MPVFHTIQTITLTKTHGLKLKTLVKKSFCIELLKKDYDSKDYDDLTKDNFAKIAYLFAIQGNDFYFQKSLQAYS